MVEALDFNSNFFILIKQTYLIGSAMSLKRIVNSHMHSSKCECVRIHQDVQHRCTRNPDSRILRQAVSYIDELD